MVDCLSVLKAGSGRYGRILLKAVIKVKVGSGKRNSRGVFSFIGWIFLEIWFV